MAKAKAKDDAETFPLPSMILYSLCLILFRVGYFFGKIWEVCGGRIEEIWDEIRLLERGFPDDKSDNRISVSQ